MDLQTVLKARGSVEAFQRKHRVAVLTLLFTDLVDSTRLKASLGDGVAVAKMQEHHEIVRETLRSFKDAEEISTAGDSFFIVLSKPSDAVLFALELHYRLRQWQTGAPHCLMDRIGIHVGEVIIEADAAGGIHDLFGIQVDTCARVMGLASGGQTLLTRVAFDHARQALKTRPTSPDGSAIAWLNHGAYLIKGLDEPIELCEVRVASTDQLPPPTSSDKARRVQNDGELVLGWRPAVGQIVPNTHWVLEERLGEGSFGEAWKAFHPNLQEFRVFKFCFRSDRVRSLKREITLFRILKERVGAHPNIVAVQDVYLDSPPFYLVMDYAKGIDLPGWSGEQGGIQSVPLELRIEIAAQIAEALFAAHSAGIVHRDIKPSNIIICSIGGGPEEGITAKLTDFGIGQIVSQEVLAGLTRAGFTNTVSSATGAQSGTLMYMAPELIAGGPATLKSDFYAFGVVLYQMIVGEFSRPLTTDWQQEIGEPLLREDLAKCFSGSHERRWNSGKEIAEALRALPARRQQALEVQAKRRWRRTLAVASLATVLLGLAFSTFMLFQRDGRTARMLTSTNSIATDSVSTNLISTNSTVTIHNIAVVNRARDQSQYTLGVEFGAQYQPMLSNRLMGVEVMRRDTPDSLALFRSRPLAVGKSRRNFALWVVSYEGKTNFSSDRLIVYSLDPVSWDRRTLGDYSFPLDWKPRSNAAPVSNATGELP